ncbi:portal protein [uncultured Arcobacter sp.]|uniref:portal protein n=1 Tax=uncultured Arcobacter sp. TaxID=165434 RepID=UPI002610B20C|nr:portal protein [uncultured Arcobacter sp.]
MNINIGSFKELKSIFKDVDDSTKSKIRTLSIELDDPELPIIDTNNGAFYFDDGTQKFDSIYNLVSTYRDMSAYNEVDDAIQEIVNECIVNEEGNVCEANLDNVELSKSLKNKFIENFEYILKVLKFNKRADDIFRQWYVDGRLYLYLIYDPNNEKRGIVDIEILDPLKIKRYQKVDDNKIYYQYEKDDVTIQYGLFKEKGVSGIIIPEDYIVFIPSGKLDGDNDYYVSYLHKTIKPLNQLKLLEDSAIIYRLTRAPERRVFYIDTGNQSKSKAQAYMKEIAEKLRNRLTYDVVSGSISQRKSTLTMQEDIFLPRGSNSRSTDVDTLQGGMNISEIADIEYFKNKLYNSFNVPVGRFSNDNPSMIDFSRASELPYDEMRFSKFCRKLQSIFSQVFLEPLKKHLIITKVMSDKDWSNYIEDSVYIEWNKDNTYVEAKKLENMSKRYDMVDRLDAYKGVYISKKTIMQEVLGMTEEEIDKEQEQMDKEKEEASDEPENEF